MTYKKIDYYYFGGMVAEDIYDIYESLVEDDDYRIREELPDDLLERFDSGEDGEDVYNYIVYHVKSVYIEN